MDRLGVQYKLRGALLNRTNDNNTQRPQSKMYDAEREPRKKTDEVNPDTSKPGIKKKISSKYKANRILQQSFYGCLLFRSED